LVAAGCGVGASPPIAQGIRTYHVRSPALGDRNLCPASLAVDPVVGVFAGDTNAAGDRSWLVSGEGQRIYVTWPEGFTLAFEPGATLRNEEGRIVAEADTTVTLTQVNRFDHAGTPEDPYLATGIVFGGCYQRATS
jgi:hypothetical protein